MRARICNRTLEALTDEGLPQFVLPADDWYHIEVSGEHPNRAAGVVQVIDSRAVDSIVKNFDPGETGLLIDQDHFSHDQDKETTAMGWLMAVRNRGGELYGKIRWSGAGLKKVRHGDLRLFSTEYEPADLERLDNRRVRPLRLSGLALTNRPNNKGGKPISNRDDASAGSQHSLKQSGGGNSAAAPTKEKRTMKNIAKALGLPEEASEGDILAKVAELKKAKTTVENRVTELEGDLETIRNREVDELMEQHKGIIGDDEEAKAFWRGGLVTNREITLKQLASLADKKPAKLETARLHNRSTAKTPEPVTAEAKKQDAKKAAAIRNRADSIVASEGIQFPQAFAKAQAELAD